MLLLLLDVGTLDVLPGYGLLCMLMDGALLYVMFLVHTQTKDGLYDLGFDPRVVSGLYSDSATCRSLVHGLLYFI